MSKLAHSHQPSMDEIERRALAEPPVNDDPPDDRPSEPIAWNDDIPVNIYGEETIHEGR